MSQIRSETGALEALDEYLDLGEELARLEARQDECECDSDNFHTCDLCTRIGDVHHGRQVLLELWGNNWAILLSQLRRENAQYEQSN